jgi:mannosyltransferase OCH1-like enzyme
MIPKIIHYCWFGQAPLPKSALKCISTWKKYFPEYEIRECNERNFDVSICEYTKEAYKLKKYAFVSDYARFWLLFKYGGIYFDIDVQVLKSFDEILMKGNFMGFEEGAEGKYYVNPGIAIGVEPNSPFIKEMLSIYDEKNFSWGRGMDNIVSITTRELVKKGLILNNTKQKICNFNIYPTDYFCPLSNISGKLNLTSNSVSIHLYNGSWLSPKYKLAQYIKMTFGETFFVFLCKFKRLFTLNK